ncbi:MAG: nitrous oxide reductase family maturation protein NosD [Tepidisphaeraceae bacterium]
MRYLMMAILALASTASAASLDLQARIDAAQPNETIHVPAGVYGPIVVSKPLTLIGDEGATLDGGGKGDVVLLAGAACTIRHFIIRGSGDNLDRESTGLRAIKAPVVIEDCRFEDVLFGIDLKSSPHCVIRRNHLTSKPLDIARRGDVIRLFRSDDCLIEDNIIEHGRDALIWYSDRVTIRRNLSRFNRYGFHAMYANHVTIEDNELTGNSVGVYLMYGQWFDIRGNRIDRNRGVSGYGIGLKEVDHYDIHDNLLTGNRVGTYIDGSPIRRKPGTATLHANTMSCNDIGMTLLTGVKGNQIVGNNFIDNVEQVAVQGRGTAQGNDFSADGRGNFWSDYNGFDANHDGLGDHAYAATQLFESLIDREPKLRLMLFSPAHDAIEFIGRALPSVRPAPKFADAHPLMKPVDMTVVPSRAEPSPISLRTLSLALLGVVGLLFAGLFYEPSRVRRTLAAAGAA